jgi:hypothetical protein
MAIAEDDLEILIPVLNVVAQVAVNGAPSLIPRSMPLHYDSITGQLLDELARKVTNRIWSLPGPEETGLRTKSLKVLKVHWRH